MFIQALRCKNVKVFLSRAYLKNKVKLWNNLTFRNKMRTKLLFISRAFRFSFQWLPWRLQQASLAYQKSSINQYLYHFLENQRLQNTLALCFLSHFFYCCILFLYIFYISQGIIILYSQYLFSYPHICPSQCSSFPPASIWGSIVFFLPERSPLVLPLLWVCG